VKKREVAESRIAIAGALLVAAAIDWAGSQGGVTALGTPLFV